MSGQTQQGVNLALGRGWEGVGKGVRAKQLPLLELRSSAIFPTFIISCHPSPSDRLEQAIFYLKLQMVQFRKWCIRPFTFYLFSRYNQIAALRCPQELSMQVHLAFLVSMFYLIEITTLFLLENSRSTVCKFHRFKRKLAVTVGYFHPGW